MKINLIQSSIEWQDIIANKLTVEQYLDKCKDADVCLFAEMFTTGYSMQPNECADKDESTLRWMQKQAHKRNIALGGSVVIEEHGLYYNRFYFVRPDGSYKHYDKRHLFSFSGEDKAYTAGSDRVVVTYQDVRILLLVCYDIRFPVWCRNTGDYDLIACVANWPTSRRKVWDTLLAARAIENQAYVCGVNIIGNNPSGEYSGGSFAIDYLGNVIDSLPDNTSGIIELDIDLTKLNNFRTKFPALNDADKFTIIK